MQLRINDPGELIQSAVESLFEYLILVDGYDEAG